ncbi:hypothetical protein [Clostridium felsineum]|uniref:Uncharacterized protein n=1 Tax=Clostridium felsineum TaxID=36839 RepID=A0A1S8MHG5_9CLOT|nr:hypothetical protein [Clostridium felsineum]URZ00360.1 hypothetical protein CLAUR_003480 [Clostridium felsineum]URZ07005.1 hypothetical protein CLROS_023380 [Clostridium felsineum]URZ12035.1 hypothetical protein CROST_027520 [Clostridium felsineum]
MGVSGIILKDRRDYLPEEFLRDVMTAVFKSDFNLRLEACDRERYDENGLFKYTKFLLYTRKDDFIFEVFSLNNDLINEDEDNKFNYIDLEQKLYSIAVMHDIEQNEEAIFKFSYEYLKLNPKDYICFEDDFAFNFQDMEKLSKLPYDEYWCYKNPGDE